MHRTLLLMNSSRVQIPVKVFLLEIGERDWTAEKIEARDSPKSLIAIEIVLEYT